MDTETQETAVAVIPERLIQADETKPLGFSVDPEAVNRFMERATPRQKAAVVADLLPEVKRLVQIAGVYVRDYMGARKMEAIPLGDGRKLELKKDTASVSPDIYKEGQRLLGEDGFGDEDEVQKLYTEVYGMQVDERLCQTLGLNFADLKARGIIKASGRPGGLIALKAAAKLGGPGGKYLADELEQAVADAPNKLKMGGKRKTQEIGARIEKALDESKNPQLNPFAPKGSDE